MSDRDLFRSPFTDGYEVVGTPELPAEADLIVGLEMANEHVLLEEPGMWNIALCLAFGSAWLAEVAADAAYRAHSKDESRRRLSWLAAALLGHGDGPSGIPPAAGRRGLDILVSRCPPRYATSECPDDQASTFSSPAPPKSLPGPASWSPPDAVLQDAVEERSRIPATLRLPRGEAPAFAAAASPPKTLSSTLPEADGVDLGVDATRSSRLFARIVDNLVWGVGPLIAAVGGDVGRGDNDFVAGTLVLIGFCLLLVVLVLNIVFLATRSQTIGKRALGIMIAQEDRRRRASFVRIVLAREAPFAIAPAFGWLGSLFVLVDVLFILGKEGRCLHDYVAGTRVVESLRWR